MTRILAISGSLRRASNNTLLLRATAALAPAGVDIRVYGGLGDLPLFNPDIEGHAPASVKELCAQLRAVDGVLIASPEYAHGVTGAMKNALDWLVGTEVLVDKPVALFNASPRATLAQAALTETLRVMAAYIVTQASITVALLGKNLDQAGIVAHPEIAGALRSAIQVFVRAIEARRVRHSVK
jgi:NAD(P)H-dependent FMN reductase